MNKHYVKSVIFIVMSVIFWGISFISTKVVLAEIPPVSIAFFRQLIAIAALAATVIYTRSCRKMPLKDLLLLALSCFFGIVLYFIFENNGLRYTSASNASMIVSSVPVFTLISEALFFKMKIRMKTIVFILISILGVYLVISVNGRLDFSSKTFLGNALAMGAMVSWVIYTIISRSLGGKYSSLIITTYQTAVSIFLFIPFILPEMGQWRKISAIALGNLLFLGLCCSAAAYFFFLSGLKGLGATVCSSFLNMIPVVSVIAGYLILGETLSFLQLAGMALILVSLFKLTSPGGREKAGKSEAGNAGG